MFFCVSSQELTRALEKSPDDAEYYCQRAYAHILLQNYTDVDDTFTVWIKRCEEMLNEWLRVSEERHFFFFYFLRYDWYQTESHVIVTVMIKNAQKDGVRVQFSEKEVIYVDY
ncbi:hypothetical protein CIB84_006822 [Bambusicola thoracicus]|uniref:CS domain-containing protein n=1 Tax=Bambusicola thoracicus TaxID=9083 RepID=A0A2P4SZ92_BAMTH|nr:hypothetical protein CIB84_006822 [Bambusicola thoracicus]